MRKFIFVSLCFLLSVYCVRAQSVTVPTLPVHLEFAGEAVPLNFPDVRNALERELGVTMYSHSRTLLTLRATKRYFALIEPILKKYEIPLDFKYLCMAESGLNPEAISPAKAAGLWQLMPGTAKEFGIEVGPDVDLRYDVEQSTAAACRYLKQAYAKYGSWTLAAASYNAGMGGVSRRLNTQGVASYYDLYLPEETLRYVHRILAFKVLVGNPSAYGFELRDIDYFHPFENYDVMEVSGQDIDWSVMAHGFGTNYKVLRSMNAWIRSYKYANEKDKVYTLLVPRADFRSKGF